MILLALFAAVGPTARATTITAAADTYTDSSSATVRKNYGSSGIIAVSATRIALIRFGSTAIAQTPGGSARLNLKVFVTKNEHNGVSVRLVRGPWTEGTVTSRTLPPMETIALDEK